MAIVGPRQAGKSTLARHVVEALPGATYVSLDDLQVRSAAAQDPAGFVSERPGLLAIDEIQRVPELLLAIKSVVDRDPTPGQFLITGSSQLSANRDVVETLAGRIERLSLWPFSQDELSRQEVRPFVDQLLDGTLPESFSSDVDKAGYLERALAGGFPEAMTRAPARRGRWFTDYVATVLEREAPGVAASPRTADLPRLLRLVAARHASLLNIADLAADAGLARTSVTRYLDVLEAVFLSIRLPAWAPNLSQREIRAPKILVTDAGLAAHLRRADLATLVRPELAAGADGPILEGFAILELLRQSEWSMHRPTLSHYRDRQSAEIDLIVEGAGRVAAIEIKAGPQADRTAVLNLARLRDQLGSRFAAGVVLHTGRSSTVLGDRLFSMPLAVVWKSGSTT